jgi:hypothetical protein
VFASKKLRLTPGVSFLKPSAAKSPKSQRVTSTSAICRVRRVPRVRRVRKAVLELL